MAGHDKRQAQYMMDVIVEDELQRFGVQYLALQCAILYFIVLSFQAHISHSRRRLWHVMQHLLLCYSGQYIP